MKSISAVARYQVSADEERGVTWKEKRLKLDQRTFKLSFVHKIQMGNFAI